MADPHTPDEYLQHLRAYDDDLLDHVDSLQEWRSFKAALERWVAEHDAAWDDIARGQEHEDG